MSATPGFKLNHSGSGFYLTFENGYTLSVQFGPYTYSDNYKRLNLVEGSPSATAEIAASAADGRWVWDEQVRGYQTPADVLAALVEIAALPAKESVQ